MPKRTPWNLLIEIVERYPYGATLEEVMVGLSPPPSRRTLQRWMSYLVKNNKIVAIGQARATRYCLPSVPKTKEVIVPELIPLSKESKQIIRIISQPIQSRKPVGYNRFFLESYIPNTTHFLPISLRKKLLMLGGSEDGRYPAGTYAQKILHRLLIDLSWNSSRLEGNTYSLLETERLFQLGKAASGKDLRETQMIMNHKAAIQFLVNSAQEIGVNRYTILNLHTLLSDNLMPDPAACGRLRTISVGIEKSVYLPCAIPPVIEECFNLLIEKAEKITDVFEQSFFLMMQLPYLQAFDDVNKRTSRLAANIPLIRNNLCPLSFIDVPVQTYIDGLLSVYELNRVELLRDVFEWAYERSCALYSVTRRAIEPDPFRMQYRSAIQRAIQEIVHQKMDKTQAIKTARRLSDELIPEPDRFHFTEIIDKELNSLHEGNVARYHLQLCEFNDWKQVWQKTEPKP